MSDDKKQGKLYQQIENTAYDRELGLSAKDLLVVELDEIKTFLDEAKADIAAHPIPSTYILNLGGYVLVEKSVLLKWFGE